MNERPITEDGLQAFVDDALDAARQAEIAAYLEKHPEVAARIAAYRRLRADLRDALQPVADEPVPPELNLAHMIEARRRGVGRWRAAATAVILLGIGLGGGWSLHEMIRPAPEGITALAQEAADNYRVFAPDLGRPVEIKAADEPALVKWASRRLNQPVAIPDLSASGYRFMGGRVVATPHGPALFLMYDDDQGTRIVMLSRPMSLDRDVAMAPHANGAVAGYAWAANGVGYSLVGPLSPEILHPIADEVRRQFGRGI